MGGGWKKGEGGSLVPDRMARARLLVLLALALVLAAGCLGKEVVVPAQNATGSNGAMAGSGGVAANTTQQESGPKVHIVRLTSMGFVPPSLEIGAGERVRWVNEHDTVRLMIRGEIPVERTLFRGDEFEWGFYTPGRYVVETSLGGRMEVGVRE